MHVEDVRSAVAKIRAEADDDEAAHITQDALYADVLRTIAAGCGDPHVLAAEALKAEDIEFSRWHA